MPFSFTDAAALVNPAYFRLPESNTQPAWDALHSTRNQREAERRSRAEEAHAAASLSEQQRQAIAEQERLRDKMAQEQAQFQTTEERLASEQEFRRRKAIADLTGEAWNLPEHERQPYLDMGLSSLGAEKVAGNTEADLLAESERNRASLMGMGFGMDLAEPAGGSQPMARDMSMVEKGPPLDYYIDEERVARHINPITSAGQFSESATWDRINAPDKNINYSDQAIDQSISELAGDGPDLSQAGASFAPRYKFGDGQEVVAPDFVQMQRDVTDSGARAFEAQIAGVIPRETQLFEQAVGAYREMAPTMGASAAAQHVMREYVNPAANRMSGEERTRIGARARVATGGGAQGRYEDMDWDRGHSDAEQAWNTIGKPAAEAYVRATNLSNDLNSPELDGNPIQYAAAVTSMAKLAGEDRVSDADANRYAGVLSLIDQGADAVAKALSGDRGEQFKSQIRQVVGAMESHAKSKLISAHKSMEGMAARGKSPRYTEGFTALSDSYFEGMGVRKKRKPEGANGGVSGKAAEALAGFE